MCGRYSITLPPDAMRSMFRYAEQPNFPPRYNVAPTQPIPVVLLADGRRAFALMRWGLWPSWLKDPKGFPTLINARVESLGEKKPAFRNAFRRRRCLVPADGFYEWQKTGSGPKVPHFIRRPDGAPFAFAGLWETWQGPDGEEVDTAAIVTTTANAALKPLHDRVPVVVPEEGWERWLDAAGNPPESLDDLLQPPADDFFEAHPVSSRVNSVASDGPELQAPLEGWTKPEPAAAKRRAEGEGGEEDGEAEEEDPRQLKLF